MRAIILTVLLSLSVSAADILPKKYKFDFIDNINYLIFEDLLETNQVSYQSQSFKVFGLERRNGTLRSAVAYDIDNMDVTRKNGMVYIDMTDYDLNRNRDIFKTRFIGMRTTVYTETGILKDRIKTNYVVRRFSR